MAYELVEQVVVPLDSGDTAWMMFCCVLVTLMVLPGLTLFYAGLVRRKNALATGATILGSMGFATVAWLAIGYSLAFTEGNGWIGGTRQWLLEGLPSIRAHELAPSVPHAVFIMFQLAFAMVTVALIYGAVVERIRFASAMVFATVWLLVVYAPVAHWVWHPKGWLHQLGHLDFAGGTVVHLAAGIAALVLVKMTGNRLGYGREPMAPHNLMLSLTGAAMLWLGWFGFNGGSAMGATPAAGMAMLATQVAAATGVLGWLACEWLARGRVSLLGLTSGLIAGLICVTPASGYTSMAGASIMGLVGAVLCFFATTTMKERLGYDDSLDVFGLHGVAGFAGTVLAGVFQAKNADVGAQLVVQLGGALAVVAYVAAATAVIAWALRATLGLRVQKDTELGGLDIRQHGESLAV